MSYRAIVLFVYTDGVRPSQHLVSHLGTRGLKLYLAEYKCLAKGHNTGLPVNKSNHIRFVPLGSLSGLLYVTFR